MANKIYSLKEASDKVATIKLLHEKLEENKKKTEQYENLLACSNSLAEQCLSALKQYKTEFEIAREEVNKAHAEIARLTHIIEDINMINMRQMRVMKDLKEYEKGRI